MESTKIKKLPRKAQPHAAHDNTGLRCIISVSKYQNWLFQFTKESKLSSSINT
jgi:hypothetical protein